jgi:pilus assembly protein Flp/PilA
MWHRTQRDQEDGASAVEYGLLVTAIAGVIVLLVFTLGKFVLNDMFQKTCTSIQDQGSLAASCTG